VIIQGEQRAPPGERQDVTEEEKKGYYLRERTCGSMTRIIPLPADVGEQDADASFRNGVLRDQTKKGKGSKREYH